MTRAVHPRSSGSPAAPTWRQVGAAVFAGAEDSLFAVKTFASAILAFWIALRIGLERPYWAVTTCFIVAQPLAGAVLSKALFRLIGTVAGAATAVILVPTLVNAPELLTLALALWLGVCTYISMLDRSPRAYLFLLAGYTAAIIGFPAVSQPGAIFTLASVRTQEIGIGIICSALVHALVFPRSVSARLRSRTAGMVTDAQRLSSQLLDPGGDRLDHHLHHRLVRDIGELDLLATHLPFDLAHRPVRAEALRALQHQLMDVLALSGAVADRLARIGSSLPSAIATQLAHTRDWLAQGGILRDVIRDISALEPDPKDVRMLGDALSLSLLDRLGGLVTAHEHCRQLGEVIEYSATNPSAPAALAVSHKPHRHLDHWTALRGAAATMLTVLATTIVWIGSAWPDGAGAVVLGSILCALFANLDDPTPTGRGALIGVLLGSAIAMIYDFAILPRVTEFPVLAAVLAPVLILIAVITTRPGYGPVAIGMILVFPSLLMLGRTYQDDFLAYANSAVAQTVGAIIATMSLRLVRGIGSETRTNLLVSGSRKALDRHFLTRKGSDAIPWIATMLDRVGLLSATPSVDDEERTKEILAMLRRLRMGMSIDQLRQLQHTATGRDAALIELLLRRGRAAVRTDGRAAAARRFTATTELALRRLLRDADPPARRAAVIASVGMVCNL